MTEELFDRFTGLAHAREALAAAGRLVPGGRARLVGEGKHARLVRQALGELAVEIAGDAEVRVVGTLSPGPMLDALEREARLGRVALCPWSGARPAGVGATADMGE